MNTRALVTGIAALFLATGAAHAVENECKTDDTYCQCDSNGCRYKWPSPNLVIEIRRVRLEGYCHKEDYSEALLQLGKDGNEPSRIGITSDAFDKAARVMLEKALRVWRKCDAYYQCLT